MAHAYNTLNQYKSFLEQLKEAEEEVNRAAVKTLGSQADTETLSRIEAASHHMRLETAQKRIETCRELAEDKGRPDAAGAAEAEIETLEKKIERLTALIDRKEAKISEE